MGRIPAASSRRCIHAGELPFLTPSNQRAVKRGQPSASSITTLTRSEAGAASASRTDVSGRRTPPPTNAATSRATPTIDSASPRFGLTSTSSTTSPSSGRRSAPSGSSSPEPRMWIPSASSPSPSSIAEQSIPCDSTPRILVRSMRRPPVSTEPTSATGTSCPTAMLSAPHTTCSGSPEPTSTLVSHSLSAFGCRSTERSRPTTTSVQSAPETSIALTSRPRIVSSSASACGARSKVT